MAKTKRFKWVVEFEVDEAWVADGFNLDADRAKAMLLDCLGFANDDEVSARIVAAPKPSTIARAQGYAPEGK